MVGDVDALQGLFVRGLAPPIVALLAAALCIGAVAIALPPAALVLALGLATGGIAVPALAGRLARTTARRRTAARAELMAELVDALRGAPELVAFGREDDALARIRDADRTLVRLGRRDALAAGLAGGLSVLVAGATVAGVLAVAVQAHANGSLDRLLVATVALLALASFEVVTPLPAAARELSEAVSSGRRVLQLTDGRPAVRDPAEALPPPRLPAVVTLEGVTARYGPDEAPALSGVDLTLAPGRRWRSSGRAAQARRPSRTCCSASSIPRRAASRSQGGTLREYRQADVRRLFALAGQDAHLFQASIRANLCSPGPRRATRSSLRRSAV